MVKVNGEPGEVEAYEQRPLDHLVVQDAVIIVAVYAAHADPENSENEIKRIASIAGHCPACVEKMKGITSRINRFVNVMRSVDPEFTLEKALEVLDSEMRKIAFELAAEVVVTGAAASDKKEKTLDTLMIKMGLDAEFAANCVERITRKVKSH
jgi:hypothetical protein